MRHEVREIKIGTRSDILQDCGLLGFQDLERGGRGNGKKGMRPISEIEASEFRKLSKRCKSALKTDPAGGEKNLNLNGTLNLK